MNNHRIVLSIRIIKHILSEFVGLFVCMYLLNLDGGGIKTIVWYNIIVVSVTYLSMVACGSIAKSPRRTMLMHLGVMFHVIYFAMVALMGAEVVKFYYIPAVIMGLSEGLFWSCLNVLTAEGVENGNRRKFQGTYTAIKGIVSILFPVLVGNTIYQAGFRAGLVFVGVLSIINMVLGMCYVDEKCENSEPYHISVMFRAVMDDMQVRRMFLWHLFTGMIYSAGAFSTAVNIFMIGEAGNSRKAGWMAGALGLLSLIVGYVFSKFLCSRKRQRNASICATAILAGSTLGLVFFPCPASICVFYFSYGFYKDIMSNVDALLCDGYANSSGFIRNHKTEYYILGDTSLVVGRISSFLLLYTYACTMCSACLLIFLVPMFIIGAIFYQCLCRV